jgi:hypothetical protein
MSPGRWVAMSAILALALLLGVAQSAPGGQVQALDRVVASIGKAAITESDLMQEYRLEGFLDSGRVPMNVPGPEEMKKLRNRLIDQKLLEYEAAGPESKDDSSSREALERLAELEKKFPNPEAFQEATEPLGLNKEQLLKKIAEQQRILHIVDDRLRPAAVVDSDEISAYYQHNLLPELQREGNQKPPPLSAVEAKIHEILVEKKMNKLLAGWLAQLRTSRDVELLPM